MAAELKEIEGTIEQVSTKDGETNGKAWKKYGYKIDGSWYNGWGEPEFMEGDDVIVTYTMDKFGFGIKQVRDALDVPVPKVERPMDMEPDQEVADAIDEKCQTNVGKPPEREEKSLVPAQVDMVSVDKAVQYWDTYQEVTKKILNESDYQSIGDKAFKKKSAWRKYMRFYSISTSIVKEDIVRDEKGNISEAKYIVRATAPNMQAVEAVGLCDRNEPNMAKRLGQLKNHDILATAQTRATSRAVSDIIGAGEVSAEEVSE
jgi:hypothetical protein